jgi:ATP/maltotriose-dependent transcriptional regulator MalT
LARIVKDDLAVGIALTNLGDNVWRLGDLARAAEIQKEALELFEELGAERQAVGARCSLGKIAHARGDSVQAIEYLTSGVRMAHAGHDALATAACLDGLAVQASVVGDPRLGAKLLGAADTLLTKIGAERTGAEAAEYQSNQAAIRTAAGQEAFETAWAEGAVAPLAEIIETAASITQKEVAPSPDSPAEDEAARALGLTRRELDVLRLFVAGRTNAEIAETLSVSLAVATMHIGNVLTKLGVDSRAGVTATAFKHGLV